MATEWKDGKDGGTPITAAELNRIEADIVNAGKSATWGSVSNRPSTFPPAIGTTADTALAGNTSLLKVGTTATTAAAGNHTHADLAKAADLTALAARVKVLEDAAAAA